MTLTEDESPKRKNAKQASFQTIFTFNPAHRRSIDDIDKATIRLEVLTTAQMLGVTYFFLSITFIGLILTFVFFGMIFKDEENSKPVFILDVTIRSFAFCFVLSAFICFCIYLVRYRKALVITEDKRNLLGPEQVAIFILLLVFLIGPGFGLEFIFHYISNFDNWRRFSNDTNPLWIMNPVQDTFNDDPAGLISKVLAPVTVTIYVLLSYLLTLSLVNGSPKDGPLRFGILKSQFPWVWCVLALLYATFVIVTSFVFDFVPSAIPFVQIFTIIAICTTEPRSLTFNGVDLYEIGVVPDDLTSFCLYDDKSRNRLIVQLICFALEVVFFVFLFRFSYKARKKVHSHGDKARKQGFYFFVFLSSFTNMSIIVQSIFLSCLVFKMPSFWIVTFRRGDLSIDPLRVAGLPFEFFGQSTNCLVFTSFLLTLAYVYSPCLATIKRKAKENLTQIYCTESEMNLSQQIKRSTKRSPIIVFETVKQMLYHSNLAYTVADSSSDHILNSVKRKKLCYNEAESDTRGNILFYKIVDTETDAIPVQMKYYIATSRLARDSHCVISASKDRIIVSVRGTVTRMNWLTNLRVAQSTLFDEEPDPDKKKVKVHRGFRTALNADKFCESLGLNCFSVQCFCFVGSKPCVSLNCCSQPDKDIEKDAETQRNFWACVENKVEELLRDIPNRPVVFTGHSLGGAMAQVFSYVFKQRHQDVEVGCYIFAAPRSGNYSFKEGCEELVPCTLRFEMVKDFVPTMPWRCYVCKPINAAYYHAGARILMDIHGNGAYFINPTVTQLMTYNYLRCCFGGFARHRLTTHMDTVNLYEAEHLESTGEEKCECYSYELDPDERYTLVPLLDQVARS